MISMWMRRKTRSRYSAQKPFIMSLTVMKNRKRMMKMTRINATPLSIVVLICGQDGTTKTSIAISLDGRSSTGK